MDPVPSYKVLQCDKSGDHSRRKPMVEAAGHNHNGGNDLKNIIDCYKILVAGDGDLSYSFISIQKCKNKNISIKCEICIMNYDIFNYFLYIKFEFSMLLFINFMFSVILLI